MNTKPQVTSKPVFGHILMGGSLSGALIRDIRLANELAERGYEVHIWWAMDTACDAPLDKRIHQHVLFSGLRYAVPFGRPIADLLGKLSQVLYSDKKRARTLQKRQKLLATLMGNFLKLVADGVEKDPGPLNRYVRQVTQAGVTHQLPMLAALVPYALAARSRCPQKPKCQMIFQGYELYINYARALGIEQDVYARFRQCANETDWQAVCVSEDYKLRVMEDIKVDADRLIAIPPGVPAQRTLSRTEAWDWLKNNRYQGLDQNVPLITFVGRQDVEKGIDLLLYACKILQQRGVKFKLFIGGPTLFGESNQQVISQLIENLRLNDNIYRTKMISEKARIALFAASTCVVYPSIHREPFGMVPVEAAAFGTPAVVPGYGGVAQTVAVNGLQCGLHFDVWNSGSLADELQRLIEDKPLWNQLSEQGPAVADYYSIANLANRILDMMELPHQPA
ncbi:MAG: glycosyltransferase family 4 protein [Phycisphaeraceae bacterium]|nr:glycosyltransferase family 4 protein [Phycisphaeraceae bacterium]